MSETELRDLASEFQVRITCDQINALRSIEDVKQVACELVRLNAGMKQTFNLMIMQGWLPE